MLFLPFIVEVKSLLREPPGGLDFPVIASLLLVMDCAVLLLAPLLLLGHPFYCWASLLLLKSLLLHAVTYVLTVAGVPVVAYSLPLLVLLLLLASLLLQAFLLLLSSLLSLAFLLVRILFPAIPGFAAVPGVPNVSVIPSIAFSTDGIDPTVIFVLIFSRKY
jgi:hypothetical protein